jgi:O-antigen/teichoic acid export membrane protein
MAVRSRGDPDPMLNGFARRRTTKRIGFVAALKTQISFDFRILDKLKTAYPLMVISAIEFGLPLVRMIVLTHLLPLREVGFVSVLTAFIAFIEVSSDLGMYRFVYAAPKAQFQEALASAHALSAVRGIVLCLLALCAAPFVAEAVSLGDYWLSFAVLAPAFLLRSCEHLAPRAAERDFQYWPQAKTLGVSLGFALVALIVTALITRNHLAIIVSVYAQNIGFFFASRWFAGVPYRLDFRSPLFEAAFRFGYPLIVNGLGMSIAQQGDRFIVAGFFNLQTVAVYSVVVLATTMPIGLLGRVLGSTVLARLYHAKSVRPWLSQEVRAASTVVSVAGAMYGGAVILVMDPVITLIFGAKFRVDALSMALLGTTAFARFVRAEPFNSTMLNAGRTKRLAVSNVLVSSSLAYMVLFSFFDRSINAVLAARLAGEVTGLAGAFYAARRVPEGGRSVFTLSTAIGFLFVVFAGLESIELERSGQSFPLLVAAFVAVAIPTGLWGLLDLRRQIRRLRTVIARGEGPQASPIPS